MKNEPSKRSSNVIALMMAAGYSRRFGKADKRLATITDGRSLLAVTIAQAEQAFPLVRVVIREEDSASLLGLDASTDASTNASTKLIRVRHAHFGLGASIAEAVQTLSHDTQLNHITAVAILLADMPTLQQDTLQTLQQHATHDTILRPSHAGNPGHPVIFGRTFWPELALLSGDAGGKELIHRHASHYREYEVQDAGTLIDIDTPTALAQARLTLGGG